MSHNRQTPSLAVAVAQFSPIADRGANLSAVADLVADAASRGAELVLFPEYSSYFIDPFDESLAANAEPIDGPFTTALVRMAEQYGIVIAAGLVESAADNAHVHNTVVAVNERGVLATYRKLHLYDAFGQRESDWIERGDIDTPQVFDVAGIPCALMTCYDLRFPEVARTLVDAGAELVLVPAEWVRGPLKEHHWRTLLHARAIENTIFIAASDHPPPLGVGHSMIVDPQGVEIAAAGIATGVAVAHLDRGAIERVRRVNPALALRRYTVLPLD
ncbi:carbon-nitrogen hydrolase family protein [Microbacterium marmarense]|uniref:Carbon-nitrogen hydrolase family protein n=1 Tax=Microbacterium marmarense TaxID=3122051 RepID=A0ABU8LVA7_9MICO